MNVFKNLFKEVCYVVPSRLAKRPHSRLYSYLAELIVTDFYQSGVKDVITLFHAPKVAASMRAHTLLKQAAATSQSHATEDQAADHGKQSQLERTDFDLGT